MIFLFFTGCSQSRIGRNNDCEFSNALDAAIAWKTVIRFGMSQVPNFADVVGASGDAPGFYQTSLLGFDAADDYGWGYAAGEFAGGADSGWDLCVAV
jgi:hypothetical protein